MKIPWCYFVICMLYFFIDYNNVEWFYYRFLLMVKYFKKHSESSERNHYSCVNVVCVILLDFNHFFCVPHRQVRVSAYDPCGAASKHRDSCEASGTHKHNSDISLTHWTLFEICICLPATPPPWFTKVLYDLRPFYRQLSG